MKNIADVNSEDILTELNNLDYDDGDLQLLDDEDIKPISNKPNDDALDDFLSDYEEPKKEEEPPVDLYTEKPKKDKALETFVEKVKPQSEEPVPPTPEPSVPNVDAYLNRPVPVEPKPHPEPYMEARHAQREIPNPLINTAKSVSTPVPSTPVRPVPPQPVPTSQKVELKDLNVLFDRVSSNVKGASEIVNRNAEIKRKIEERFQELRRLQQEHEENKRSDYAEINAYKEDVYAKLQQKKADIEKELVALRSDQDKLASDRKDFENYKNTALANLNALENELKNSYDTRNKNIEQVEIGLVKRKEQLDIERANLAKEREQLEKERAELADNLVHFNKLVDDFTNGINSFN